LGVGKTIEVRGWHEVNGVQHLEKGWMKATIIDATIKKVLLQSSGISTLYWRKRFVK
jgi:hypothetical protein